MNPQAFNRYSYGYNNPVKYTDPSGHCVEDSRDDYYDYECWQKADELYDKYGSTGLSYGALGTLSLEELRRFDRLLQNAWNKVGDLQQYSVRHVWVQLHFARTHTGTLLEVPIPKSGPNGGTGSADLLNPITGEIWEVKPISYNIENAQAQLDRYVENYPNGRKGSFVQVTTTIDPIDPTQNLLYASSGRDGRSYPGLIFYWPHKNRTQVSVGVNIEPVSITKWLLYGLGAWGVSQLPASYPPPVPVPAGMGGGGIGSLVK
ncbi:MAG: hypothetical protein H6668_11985 [Ardenticatenaceae bacterium]|nr:hypothetical protein [Ardenticatenaceae bacterium]